MRYLEYTYFSEKGNKYWYGVARGNQLFGESRLLKISKRHLSAHKMITVYGEMRSHK